MNKQRRNRYYELQRKLAILAEDAVQLASEEREAWDALPAGIQDSEKGQAGDIAATALEDCADSIQAAVDYLDEIEEPEG